MSTVEEAIQHQVKNAVYPIMTVLGLVANLVVIAVIVVAGKSKKNKTVANTFVLNLAVADILFLVTLPFYMPTFHQKGFPFGLPMCKLLEATKHVCFHTSIVLLTAMNFDRYVAIVHSLRSLEYRTQRNARIVCAVIWVVCFLVSAPIIHYSKLEVRSTNTDIKYCVIMFPGYKKQFVSEAELFEYGNVGNMTIDYDELFGSYDNYVYDNYPAENETLTNGTEYSLEYNSYSATNATERKPMCHYDEGHLESKPYKAWEYSTFFIFFVFPITVISFCYMSILYTARKRKVRSDSAKGMQAKVTKMVAVLISAFIICWMPFQVWKLMTLEGGVEVNNYFQCSNIDFVVALLAWSNSILNPILYSLMSENFRKRAMMTLACLRYGYPSTIRQMSISKGGRGTFRNEDTKMTLMQSSQRQSPGTFRKHSRNDSVEIVEEKEIANRNKFSFDEQE